MPRLACPIAQNQAAKEAKTAAKEAARREAERAKQDAERAKARAKEAKILASQQKKQKKQGQSPLSATTFDNPMYVRPTEARNHSAPARLRGTPANEAFEADGLGRRHGKPFPIAHQESMA